MSLPSLRKQIDQINQEILRLLAKRIDLSKKVALTKIEENIPIHDPKREVAQMQQILESAKELGLSPFVIEQIFTLIVDYSKIVQQLEKDHV